MTKIRSLMRNTTIIQKLASFGFSASESAVYLTLIERGSLSMSALAANTRVKRTSLYPIVKRLLGRGVVQKVVYGKRFVLEASDPEIYFERLATEAIESNGLIQELTPKHTNEKIYIEHISSKDQLFTWFNRITRLPRGSVVRSIEGAEPLTELGSDLYAREERAWQRECVKRGIVLKGVGTYKSLEQILGSWSEVILKEMVDRNVSPRLIRDEDFAQFGIVLVVFQNNVLVASPKQGTGCLMTHSVIAESFKCLIDFIYEQGEYVNINQHIGRKLA